MVLAQNRYMDQWNKMGDSSMYAGNYNHLIFYKEVNIPWRKEHLQQMVLRKQNVNMYMTEIRWKSITYLKLTLNASKDLNVKYKMMKPIEEKREVQARTF